jgi:hypothetical protein
LEFLELKISISSEIKSLHTVRVHLEYLISDIDNALPLLQLMLANDQIQECHNLNRLKLAICLLVILSGVIFFLIVVSRVPEVKVAIDLLIHLASFVEVAYLEESTCY